ncbi:MAG TPA: SDR family oxidoreductase [Bacteroidia bacterium]|nr:SDR family oxidoreductase [Bacteroidia bacterium]
MKKLAVITGGNRGIGFEICRQMAQKGFKVVLTARDANKGSAATEVLQAEGLDVEFYILNTTDENSITHFATELSGKYEAVDVLINNAGVLLNRDNIFNVKIDDVRKTFDVNFFGPLMVIKALLPFLQKSQGAKIINLSSIMGQLAGMSGTHLAYRTSKTALNALTVTLAADLRNSVGVYCMHPGWVKTEMGGAGASVDVKDGADTAIWLATTNQPSGGFYFKRQLIEW